MQPALGSIIWNLSTSRVSTVELWTAGTPTKCRIITSGLNTGIRLLTHYITYSNSSTSRAASRGSLAGVTVAPPLLNDEQVFDIPIDTLCWLVIDIFEYQYYQIPCGSLRYCLSSSRFCVYGKSLAHISTLLLFLNRIWPFSPGWRDLPLALLGLWKAYLNEGQNGVVIGGYCKAILKYHPSVKGEVVCSSDQFGVHRRNHIRAYGTRAITCRIQPPP
ncbi:hypothetical protein M752DRAFT_269352 [Aspergillus phoenicis ATCC 13157]|uniref:Uncharacterized protein n=1 Tax=Aspergillus phoenicis ATCC 13157 TaxID=1353007 RepID=A0A370P9A5_ASPPH|nr:hypothetical protein M752DRAFT_269352 [Aspergillus phoenicis ATCC 13157]